MFERAPYLFYADIPIAYILELGGEEFLGIRELNGDFRQIESLREIPDIDWFQVEMFGPSLGLLIPCTATITVNDEPVGQLSIRIIDGRPTCSTISAPLHGLTGALLRQIPIASLVREATVANAVRVLKTEEGIFGARYVEGGPGFGQLHDDLRAELATVDEKARRRVISSDFLKDVASIYREALSHGVAPALAVQNAFGPTTPANARRWIAYARRDGFLGPAPARGKAGEIIGHELGVS